MKYQSEIRKDYIQDKYVIISPKRNLRPHDMERPERVVKPPKETCVFCPGNIEKDLLIETVGPKNNWRMVVLKNKFPAVTLQNSKAYGTQEVIVETPDHLKELEDLSTENVVELLTVYAHRTKAICRNKKIEYIIIFKNNGGRAGASIMHSHSQIFATAFIPPHLLDKSQKIQAYKLQKGTCVFCDVIKKESKSPRFVWKDKNIIAFTPYASLHNFEIWIMTQRHIDNITLLTQDEKKSLATILKRVLKKINQLNLPYNYYFHQIVNDRDQHLYMKITPRGSVWAGVEIGSGVVINPISPEAAAKFYRNHFK